MKSIVRCDTSVGVFHIELHKEWSPIGTQRVKDLVNDKFFDKVTFNRVSPHFLVQFGIRPPDLLPHIPTKASIRDDPPRHDIPFTNGIVSFAGSGVNTRSEQIFITYGTQPGLGKSPWEVPIGIVPTKDMPVVNQFYNRYGDMPPWGKGPKPQNMQQQNGQQYLDTHFPLLTRINTCTMMTKATSSQYDSTILLPTPQSLRGSGSSDSDSDSGTLGNRHTTYSKKMMEHPLVLFGILALIVLFSPCIYYYIFDKRVQKIGKSKNIHSI